MTSRLAAFHRLFGRNEPFLSVKQSLSPESEMTREQEVHHEQTD